MSQKRIEHQFHKALGKYVSDIDDDQLWSEIENRIPEKKKKKRFLIWFAFGLPILILLWVGFWMNLSNDLDIEASSIQQVSTKPTTASVQSSGDKDLTISETHSLFESDDENENIEPIDVTAFSKSNLRNEVQKKIFGNENNEDEIIKKIEQSGGLSLPLKNDFKSVKVNKRAYEKISHIFIAAIPNIALKGLVKSEPLIEYPIKRKRNKNRLKPLKNTKSFISLNYLAETHFANSSQLGQDAQIVDYGHEYFSQGLEISYSRFFQSRWYGRFILSADQIYKKYEDAVYRDTLVPSSLGKQIITYNQYSNGVIDTESGVPLVDGVFTRNVINLNTITSMSFGLGLGYLKTIGRWGFNLEADVQRTIYYDFTGLGRQQSSNKIKDLNSFEDYFSLGPRYLLNTQVKVDCPIRKSIFLTGGLQYQLGFSSIINEASGMSEKVNLLRASFGLKKML